MFGDRTGLPIDLKPNFSFDAVGINNNVPNKQTKDVLASNRCDLSWHREGAILMLFSVIDNLGKGASGQAVQNMNIRFGFPETSGLRTYGEL